MEKEESLANFVFRLYGECNRIAAQQFDDPFALMKADTIWAEITKTINQFYPKSETGYWPQEEQEVAMRAKLKELERELKDGR